MKQKTFARILAILTVFMLCITPLASVSAKTLSKIDTDKKCELGIKFKGGKSDFYLYKVASVDSQGRCTMDQTFAKYFEGRNTDEMVNGLDSSQTDALVRLGNQIKTKIHQNKDIKPVKKLTTDTDGNGTFTDLEVGMYLILKPRQNANSGKKYLESSQIVILPSRIPDEKGNLGDWVYNPIANIKANPDEGKLDQEVSVEKQWDFSEGKNKSAKEKDALKIEIVVELRVPSEDGSPQWKIYDDPNGKHPDVDFSKIVLNKDNNWKVEFDDMVVTKGNWEFNEISRLVETEFEFFDSKINDKIEIITNKYKPTTPPPPPENTTTPPPDDTTGTTTTNNKKLPQTGQLWWPVPLLAGIGLGFFAIGALKNKYYHKKNDKNS